MNAIDSHNIRQYHKMLTIVRHAPESAESLRDIVNSLMFLHSCLQNPEKVWVEDFLHEWWILEEILAYALSEQEVELDNNSVNSVLRRMEILVSTKLSELTAEQYSSGDE